MFLKFIFIFQVTPLLGIISVILCLTVLIEPPRGDADGGVALKPTNVFQDIIEVCKM